MSVYIVGSINQDIVGEVERHPRPGETLEGTSLSYFPGGKGLNQAVASARAGVETHMIGAIGTDATGRELHDFLKAVGVQTTNIKSVGDAPTGTALITVAGGENAIVFIPGANAALEPSYLTDVDFASGDIVVAQFEVSQQTIHAAFKKARAAGAKTVLNPAPASEVPANLLSLTDYLVVNEHEFELIFKQAVTDSEEQLQQIVKKSLSGALVVTLGEAGAVFASPDQYIAQAGIEVEAKDSTGAGDCFVGYFAASLAEGMQPVECVKRANAAAALSVTRLGAAMSIPVKSDLV